MANWVNLLDIIYPIGSLYLSRSSTSPASTIGGSWTQIKGAVLAACGANSFTTNNYGGSLKISINQIPSHQHTNWTVLIWPRGSSSAAFGGDGNATAWNYINTSGGDANPDQYGPGNTLSGNVGGGQNYLPYHYGVYVWYRTA